jgi:16S rRNA G527 N7-methylase RsmG
LLALTTGRETHLVEADRRKSAFLIEAARILGLHHVKIHPTRIEAATLPQAAILTARALAPLTALLPHAHRILAPAGFAIFPKGRTALQELTDAAGAWIMRTERIPSRTDPAATILRLSEIRPAGSHA